MNSSIKRISEMSLVQMFGHLVQAVGGFAASIWKFAAGCVAGVLTPILAVTLPLLVLAGCAALGAVMGMAHPLFGVVGIGIGMICGIMAMKPIAQAVWRFMLTQTTQLFEGAGIFLKDAGRSLQAVFNLAARYIRTLVKVLYAGINILFWNVMKVSMVILAAAWGLGALLGPGAFLMMKGAPIWFSVCATLFSNGFMGAIISLGLGAVLFSAIVGTVFALLCLKPMLHYGGPCIEYIFKKSDLAWEDLKNCTRASGVVNAHPADDQKGSTEVLVHSDLDAHNQQDADQSLKGEASTLSCVVVRPLQAEQCLGGLSDVIEGVVLIEGGDHRAPGNEMISAYPVHHDGVVSGGLSP